jgi:hypothetical protein
LHQQHGDDDHRRDNDSDWGASEDDRDQRHGEDGFDGVEGAKHQPADAEPIRRLTSGARKFSGASRNEMASTVPSHTNVTAVARPTPRRLVRNELP